jgi:hypothetical protein
MAEPLFQLVSAMPGRNLTIIQFNDTHGYLEVHPELCGGATSPLIR